MLGIPMVSIRTEISQWTWDLLVVYKDIQFYLIFRVHCGHYGGL